MKRLGIAPARYVAYVEALAGQVDAAVLKAGTGGLGKQGLDALHTGCLTLGATHCAAVVADAAKSATDGPPSSALVEKIRALSALLKKHAETMRATS